MNSASTATARAGSALTCGHVRRSIDTPAAVLMTLFCLALGLQQVAIKAVAHDVTPLAQIGVRSLLAAVLVLCLAAWHGIGFRAFRAHLGAGVLIGLGFTFEFVFVAVGLNYTLASHMAVFLYTAPIFAALGLHWLVPGEQLAWRQWCGIGLAFIGMMTAMVPSSMGPDAADLFIGDALGLLGGLSWAATTLVLRRSSLSGAPSLQPLAYQLLTAAVLLLPVAALRGDLAAINATTMVVASLTFQTLVISSGALLLWLALLRRYWASQLGVFSFLSPVFGVLFGTLLLDEPLTASFVIGGGLIVAGIALVSR